MTKTRETMIAELGRRHPAAADDVDAILAMPRSDAVNEGLLACPFCNGNGASMLDGWGRFWQTSCTECHCGTPQKFETHDLAEAAWNTRAALSPSHCTAGRRPAAFLAWARETFGPVALVRGERVLRFIEEAIELAHTEGMERTVLNTVADRVYSRPAGDAAKEIGQAQACLETLAESIGLSSEDEAEREWQRVQGIPKAEWAKRHAAKQAIGIALTSEQSGRGER